jgi:hypothetical protein
LPFRFRFRRVIVDANQAGHLPENSICTAINNNNGTQAPMLLSDGDVWAHVARWSTATDAPGPGTIDRENAGTARLQCRGGESRHAPTARPACAYLPVRRSRSRSPTTTMRAWRSSARAPDPDLYCRPSSVAIMRLSGPSPSLSLSLGDADPATISTYTGAGISPVVM